jgi:hypothetical protein
MTVTRPQTHWHRALLASCTALLLACSGGSDNGGGGAGGGGAGGGGAGGGGAGGGGAGGGGTSGGGTGGATLDMNGFGQKYKLGDDEVSGWKVDTAADSFAVFDTNTIFGKIDGPAEGYVSRGMKFAFFETLVIPGTLYNCILVGMAFDNEADAKSMVTYKFDLQGATDPLPGYDASVALASEALSGITAYANFGALYLEVGVDGYGYPLDVTKASQDAAAFLKAMEAKPRL